MNGYVRSRSRFHGKRARERAKVVDMCNVTRSRRSNIFSSRREECVPLPRSIGFAPPVKNYSPEEENTFACSSIRGYDFLLRFRNTFPNSLPSENVIHLVRAFRAPGIRQVVAPPLPHHLLSISSELKRFRRRPDNRPDC